MRTNAKVLICALLLADSMSPMFSHTGIAVAQAVTTTARTAAIACSLEALMARVPDDTTIVAVAHMPATAEVPEYCKVDVRVTTPGNGVNVRLRLPVMWNGKFYFHGVGGYAGSVESGQASINSINHMLPGLVRGYAVASTDTGHEGIGTDASWALNNRAKEIDFAYRGVHVATVSAKALTETYYRTQPRLSYFAGCSGGGRQALTEAQRYPEDFDGIIAAAPAIGNTSLNRVLGYQVLLASAETYIPTAKLGMIARGVLAACDGVDGLADGLVSQPNKCEFKPDTLVCTKADDANCLSRPQVESLKKLYADFSTKDGKFKTHGYPVGHEEGPTGWQQWIVGSTTPKLQPDGSLAFGSVSPTGFQYQEQLMRYLAFEQDDPNYDWRTLKIERDMPKLEFMSRLLRPSEPDLRAFRAREGKLILLHGWSDPAISAYSTIEYLDQISRTVGGTAAADTFVRLFLAPGVTHCGGGPGPNLFVTEAITALESWVEQGTVPNTILATHKNETGVVDRTRPLCPWPQVVKYRGTGSINAAESFVCGNP